MKEPFSFFEKTSGLLPHWREKFSATTKTFAKVDGEELVRFEESKGIYVWVQPEKILFVKSADHYVKSLIQHGIRKKWVIRHSSIKGLLALLNCGNFVRLNKFYILNCNHFSRLNKHEKILYLDDNFPIPVPHRISQYILDSLK